MAPTLYCARGSPPVRAVLMTAKHLGVEFNLKEVNLHTGEQKTPEFLKINPQHTVPTLVDEDGFTIWDSHAIMPYLVSKYGKDDSLYPKDIKKRALIDQRLFFEAGIVIIRLQNIIRPILFKGKKSIDQENIDSTLETYGLLEEFLNERQWIAGDSATIADYSLISSISSLHLLVPINAGKFPRLSAWLKKSENLPGYDENRAGLEIIKNFIKDFK